MHASDQTYMADVNYYETRKTMSKNKEVKYCKNTKCKKQFLELDRGSCRHCKSIQYESNENCPHCYWPLPPDKNTECFNCKKLRSEPVHEIPCVLCGQWLSIGTEKCLKCSAPQNYHALQAQTFISCSHYPRSCNQQVLMSDSNNCFSCGKYRSQYPRKFSFNDIVWNNPHLLKHLEKRHVQSSMSGRRQPHTNGNTSSSKLTTNAAESIAGTLPQAPHRIQLRGYSKTNPDGQKSCYRTVRCRRTIPLNAHICPHCETEQYKSKESCLYCYWPLPLEKEKSCLNCGQQRPPPDQQPVEYVPCVLCSYWLKKTEKCSNCLAPQNYDALQQLTFKKCRRNSPPCDHFLILDSKTCYLCSQHQFNSTTGVLPSGVKLYQFEEIDWDNPYLLHHLKEISQSNSSQMTPYTPQTRKPCPSAFCDPDLEDQLCIVFKALIYKEAWGWNEDSQVYMRFAEQQYGDFKYDFGPGEIKKNDNKEFLWCEFQCHLKRSSIQRQVSFHTSQSKYFLQYKYTVFTGKATKEEDVYEFLNGFQTGASVVDRALVFSFPKQKERIFQYDTLVCPQLKSHSSWSIASWLPFKSVQDFANKDKLSQISFKSFLQPFKQKILNAETNCNSSFDEISEISNEVVTLFHCLSVRYTYEKWEKKVYRTNVNSIKEIVLSWIEEVLKEFRRNESSKWHHQIYGIATILLISKRADGMTTALEKTESFLFDIFGSFSSCEPLNDMVKFIKDDRSMKSLIVDALENELTRTISVAERKNNHPAKTYASILKVLAGIHVLKGKFTKPEKFKIELVEKNVVSLRPFLRQSRLSRTIRFVNTMEELKPFFDVDPSLSINLLYICPLNYFPSLCDHIVRRGHMELNLVLGVMHYNVVYETLLNENEVSKCITEPLKIVQKRLLVLTSVEEHRKFEESFENLAIIYLQKLKSNIVYKRSAFLVFCVSYVTFYSTLKDQVHKSKIDRVKEWFTTWMSSDNIVGSPKFGTKEGLTGSWDNNETELKVWKFILNENSIKEILNESTYQIKNDWYNLIRCVLESRINKLSDDKAIVDKFIKIETKFSELEFVVEVFLAQASLALNRMFEKDQSSVKSYFTESGSKSFAKLLGKLLLKQYDEKGIISLASVLEWDLWPSFFKLYGSAKTSTGTSSEWEMRCMSALSKFEVLCEDVKSRQISFQRIKELDGKIDKVKALCLPSVSSELPDPSTMESLITQRRREYESFQTLEEKLFYFIKYLKNVPVKELDSVVKKQDSKEKHLVKLCSAIGKDGRVQITCYESVKSLLPHIEVFYQLTHEHSSKLFHHFWKLEAKKYTKKDDENITFEEVITLIWNPTLKQITNFISQLKSAEIKLTMLDEALKEIYQDSLKECSCDIQQLCQTLAPSITEVVSDTTWLKTFCEHVTEYQNLCKIKESAKVFESLYKGLKLTGDFSVVERIANGVNNEECLKSIDETLIDAGKFLLSYANDLSLRKCLDKFVKRSTVVKFIRALANKDVEKSTLEKDVESNVNDLQNFVNIALATVGEGDMHTDSLVALRTVGSGFGQFIYQLPSNAGFDTLRDHCISLQKSNQGKTELLSSLKLCKRQIEWYKSIRETQGSVEKTSFGQMESINTLGVYEIGSIKPVQLKSRTEAICVHLVKSEGDKESLPKYKYTFNELRDLESKLVLIAGRKSEKRKEVDKFLDIFHSVCRIADVLVELQHHGNSDYIQWCLQFSCNMCMAKEGEEIYHLLTYQAKKMERHLEMWLAKVKDERDKFKELNYFTTPQLLMLREELGHFEASTLHSPSIKPGVMNLLYGITGNQEGSFIKERLNDVNSKLVEVEFEESSSRDEDADGKENQEVSSEDGQSDVIAETVEPKPKAKHSKSRKIKEEASSHWPKPNLKYDDLNEDQRGHYIELKESGYHELLMLLALETCPQDSELEDIMIWCDEEKDNYTYPSPCDIEEHESDSELSGEEEIEIDEELPEVQGLVEKDEPMEVKEEQRPLSYLPSKNDTNEATKERSDADINEVMETADDYLMLDEHFENMIEVKERVPLDENHEDVKTLMELGYACEEVKEALMKFPDELALAAEYLQEMDLGIEPSTSYTTGSFTRQQSRSLDEETKVKELKKMILERLDKTKKNYMPLPKLGRLLQSIAEKSNAIIVQPRCFPHHDQELIKTGEFNLIVVPPEHVLKTTLSLYMEDLPDDSKPPLPTYEEVLICTEQTTAEEVTLLWRRAFNDTDNKRIFCLVHAELLSYQVCDATLQELQEQSQGKRGYKIVIVCSNEEEDKSIIISKLQMFRRSYLGIKSNKEFLDFLCSHFKVKRNDPDKITKGSDVDEDNYRVRVLSSTRAGMGKSLYIQHLVDKLRKNIKEECYHVISIHGPKVDANSLVLALNNHIMSDDPCIFHIDISQTVLRQMGTLLFNLLILQAVCDSAGQIWRVNPNHLYLIEVTVPCDDEQAEKISRVTVDFLKVLPATNCNSPIEVLSDNEENTGGSTVLSEIYKKQFESPLFQRTFQYSKRMNDSEDIDIFSYTEGKVEGNQKECLQLLLKKSGLKDPSWLELRNFVCFLNEQLERCEKSWFCDHTLMNNTLSGFKTFIVKFMTIMSKDFCTSSLKKEVAVESGSDAKQLSTMEKNEISDGRKWHSKYHPYLFFNNDAGFMSSLTFVGFNVNKDGDVIDPNKDVIERKVIHKDLIDGLKANKVDLEENYHEWTKETQIRKIAKVMGIFQENPVDPDPSYVLTSDNVIKILAIQMKFRCNIPVVIMGETGCGKTRLIRYMCDLAAQNSNKQNIESIKNMLIMKVHGGTTPEDISKMVEDAESLAKFNKHQYGIDTILFFDEANTTDAIGLIKEVMCDQRLNGKRLSSDLKFIAACNPYRKHHKDMISKLESAGLGFYVKATESQEKLGEIPLRELVYRVFDLPPSMRPLVYDFGKLDDETEDKYTRQMVKDRCSAVEELKGRTEVINAVSQVLTWSQSFMKEQTDECSFVSLRDVERTLIVFKYFYVKREKYFKLIQAKTGENTQLVGHEAWALIMSLSVCYHARLQERDQYETDVVKQFVSPLDEMADGTKQQLTKTQFKDEIKWCQDVLLDNMTLGPNIARNAALRENVFMMTICVQLKIPLFLVGKPGSSKSLAKSVIADSLNQQTNEFLKDFNQVHMVSYQCSQLSTPESVIEVFVSAKKFQKDRTTGVVVLDEVGLAEDSPNLPLKALHPLLEDGTEKNDQEIVARENRVAFIGISNWALDPAKMNRGVMVTRADPKCEELILSAEQICTSDDKKMKKSSSTDLKETPGSNQPLEQNNVKDEERQTPEDKQPLNEQPLESLKPSEHIEEIAKDEERKAADDQDNVKEKFQSNADQALKEEPKTKQEEKGIVVKDLLNPYFKNLAEAYLEICEMQMRGKENELKRSFFGLRDFYSLIKMLYGMCKASKREPTEKQLEHAIKRNFGGYSKFDPYEVFQKHLGVKASSTESVAQSCEDDLLNPDCSTLGLIVKSLQTKSDGLSHMGESRYLLFLTENNAALQVLQHKLHEAVGLKQQKLHVVTSQAEEQEETRKKEPLVLFGSSFPKDKEYTQVCRNINQIKICMETGRTVILLNLENLYESLYDLLNQYHIVLGDSRYVDLGLQTHRVKCRVDSDFKLILIAERETVYETFPTPLINRLEKHFVLTETILLDWQDKVLKRLREWVEKFTDTRRSSFTFSEEDAIVGYQQDTPASVIFQVTKMKKEELKRFSDKDLADVSDDIYEHSRNLLLQMASPDALIRLKCTDLKDQQKELWDIYFNLQKHELLTDFVSHQLEILSKEKATGGGLSAQITTHSHLLSGLELKAASKALGFAEASSYFLLQEFDAELDFTKALDSIFTAAEPKKRLLILQCDAGHLYGDLIASARYRIDDQREKVYQLTKEKSINCGLTHVVMIVNLPRYVKTHSKKNFMFVGFQGGVWVSAHIDDVHVTAENTGITLNDAMSASISELFYSKPFAKPKEIDPIYAAEAFRGLQPDDSIIVSEEIVALNGQTNQEKVEELVNGEANGDTRITDSITNQKNSNEVSVNGLGDETTDTDNKNGITNKETTEEPVAENQNHKKDQNTAFDETLIVERSVKTDQQTTSLDSTVMSSVSSSLVVKQKFFDLRKLANSDGKGYTQCNRLHFCIQSAISMIAERDEMKRTWAAKRVKLLLKLIPAEMKTTENLGIETFYGAVVWRILDLLRDREANVPHSADWVLNEALNVTSLQSGGAFQNVLAKKIDQVLTPLFANILSFVDCYHNLDFMVNLKDMTLDQKLWLRLFNHPAICDFSHLHGPSEKYQSSGLQESLKQDFKCCFPFFWVVKDKIDAQIQDYTVGVNDMKQAHSDIYARLSLTPLAEALCIIPADEKELGKYCKMYLTDFLQCVHNVTRSDTEVNAMEIEVLHKAIYAVIKGPNFTHHDHCLLSRIVSVHVAFELHQKEIMWLGQLTSVKPGLLPKIIKTKFESKHIDIHLRAVQMALRDLEIPLGTNKDNFPERHRHLQSCQNVISSILEGASDELSLTKELRFFWNYLRIVKLFVEHIALDYKDFLPYAKRLRIFSFAKDGVCKCDCSKLKMFQNIERPLDSLIKDLTIECEKNTKAEKYFDRSKLIDVKQRKKACLSEIISTIYFGEDYNKPERDLIAALIGMALQTEQSTLQASQIGSEVESSADTLDSDMPSFLLQLLLEYNLEMAVGELKKYFEKNKVAEQSKYLLCIQCFEDAKGKNVLKDIMESQDTARLVTSLTCRKLLKVGADVLRRSRTTGSEPTITVDYLEAVANIRCVCSLMADILYERKEESQILLDELERSLLAELRVVCEDEAINDEVSGPGIFLMKQIAREHGVSFLASMLDSKSTETQWIIPEHLRSADPGKSIIQYEDRFLSVYKEEYRRLYDILVDARLRRSFDGIEETYKTLTTTGCISMLLAVYQIVTMSYGQTEESLKVPATVKESLLLSFNDTDRFNQPQKDVVKILIKCTHCERLTSLKPTFSESEMLNRLQTEVLVHTVVVFLQKKESDIFKPFINFLTTPGSMSHAYLPTFPGLLLDKSIKFAMGGAFNLCPKGDPYFITECRVLQTEHKCPKCGERVPPQSEDKVSIANKMDTKMTSVQSEEQQPNNTDIQQQSTETSTAETKSTDDQEPTVTERNDCMGYTMVNLSDQETQPKERNLSPASCGILRVLMNACLTWVACTNEEAAKGLADLFKSKDDCPDDLPSFFWERFKNNIRVLSKDVGKSEDDVCLLLHSILKKISTQHYPNGQDTQKMAALKEEENRAKWENSFSRVYIDPVVEGADDIAIAQVYEDKVVRQPISLNIELKHSNVFNFLRKKTTWWDDIGRELGVELNDREGLKKDITLDNNGRLEKVIHIWLESDPDPSWDKFIDALEKLKYNDIVQFIMEEHCKPVSPSKKQEASSPKTPSVDSDSSQKKSPHQPEKNSLHYTIYEKVNLPHPSQRLWPYRPKVTLETFFQKLNLQWDSINNSPKYPVLYYLCKHERMLNATQYLPDLIKLQEKLFKVYNRRINEVDARTITVREFIDKLPKLSAEAMEGHFKAVILAWNRAKNNLHEYGRINVPDKYKTKSWDIDTLTIDYIIPSLTKDEGPGVCTVALLEGLVQAHNGFIDNCRLEWRKKHSKENVWAQRQVLVKHVQRCHLVEYQHQLLPMVLSHCRYSLDQNRKHLVYDFDVLEKRFTDRFVHGRPSIKLEILEVKYREFSYSIANVKRVVHPKELDTREKFEILNELKSTPDLRNTLDIVQIVMGFMSMGQYRANMKLSEFVTKYLKMTDQFPSKKGLDHCNLEHVLCLWRILSVELSLRLLHSDQVPFSGLGEMYLQPLNEDDQKALLNFLLKIGNIEELLHSLFEFIETFIKHSQDFVKSSYSLIDTMVNHADHTHFEKYQDSFPTGLTVGQVVAVWKEIASQKMKSQSLIE